MLTPEAIRRCLIELAESLIFRRGIVYYALRSVGVLHAELSSDASTLYVNAHVQGSDL